MKRYLYFSIMGGALWLASCGKTTEHTSEHTTEHTTETRVDGSLDSAAHAIGAAADVIKSEALAALLNEYGNGVEEVAKLGQAVKRGDAEAKGKAAELSKKLKETEARLDKNAAELSEESKEKFKRFRERLQKQLDDMEI